MPRLLSEEYCQTGLFTNCRTYYGSINSSANHDAANWRAIRSTDFGAYNFSPYHSRTYCRTYYGSIDSSANHNAHDSQADSYSNDYAYDSLTCTYCGSIDGSTVCSAHDSQADSYSNDYAYDTFACTNRGSHDRHAHI